MRGTGGRVGGRGELRGCSIVGWVGSALLAARCMALICTMALHEGTPQTVYSEFLEVRFSAVAILSSFSFLLSLLFFHQPL